MSQTELGWRKQMVFGINKYSTMCSENSIFSVKTGIVCFKCRKKAQAGKTLKIPCECLQIVAENIWNENVTLCTCSQPFRILPEFLAI